MFPARLVSLFEALGWRGDLESGGEDGAAILTKAADCGERGSAGGCRVERATELLSTFLDADNGCGGWWLAEFLCGDLCAACRWMS